MEELLREAACYGNLQGLQKLLQNGASINSQNSMNGWTALHWACKRGHLSVVRYLLQNGAEVNTRSHKGELPVDVATTTDVANLLSGSKETLPSTPTTVGEELPIVPSYLQHPPFPFYEINIEEALSVPNTSSQCGTGHSQLAAQNDQDLVLARKMEKLKILGSSEQRSDADVCGTVNNASLCGMEEKHNHRDMQSSSHDNKLPNKEIEGLNDQGGLASLSTNPLLVKVRVVGSGESDFVEVEVPSPTYPALLKACCEELEVQTSDVVKIRKLPNVWVRKDRDVQRMKEGQELEVVLDMERSKE